MNGLSLNEGGYDYKFIEEPADSLKCLICLLVVREPQQHGGCGKLFCKVCIDKRTRDQVQTPQRHTIQIDVVNTEYSMYSVCLKNHTISISLTFSKVFSFEG